jgi:hypothetical protein
MPPGEQAQSGSRENPPSPDSGPAERQAGWNPDELDLDALAAKIIELMRRELRIELERKGRTL